MKIIAAYESNRGRDGSGYNILVWPDSAMILSRKPLFLPEEEDSIHVGIAAKIKAVGKSVKPKFAHRYYDAIAPAAFIFSSSVSSKLNRKEDPEATDIVADFSVICGDFTDAEGLNEDLTLSLSIKTLSGDERLSENLEVNNWENLLAEAIARATERNTIKTGDTVAVLLPGSFPAGRDSLLSIGINGVALIENKLK